MPVSLYEIKALYGGYSSLVVGSSGLVFPDCVINVSLDQRLMKVKVSEFARISSA